jgi:hypothetical protein
MVSTVRDLSMRGPIRSTRHTVVDEGVPAWRWVALVAVVLAIAHGQIHRQASEATLADLIRGAGGGLLPAPAVIGAWTAILFGLLTTAVFALADDQRRISLHDRVSRPVTVMLLAISAQLAAIDVIGLYGSTVLAIAAAAAAAVAYLRAQAEIAAGRARTWLGLPLGLAAGYTAVLAVAAIDASIARAGWASAAPGLALAIAVAAAAIRSGLTFRDPAVLAITAWALSSVSAANRGTTAEGAALLMGAACATVAIVIAATRVGTRRPVAKPAVRRSTLTGGDRVERATFAHRLGVVYERATQASLDPG